MKSYRFYCKLSKLGGLLLIAACQTTGAGSTVKKSLGTQPQDAKRKASILPTTSQRTSATEYFNYYCQGGKPKRSYQYAVTAFLPKVQGQLPIDLAAKLDSMILNAARKSVRDLFSPRDSLPIIAVVEPKSGDLAKTLKSSVVALDDIKLEQSDSEIIDPSGSVNQIVNMPNSFFITKFSNQVYLGATDAINFEKGVASGTGPRPEIYEKFTMLVPFAAQKAVFPMVFKSFEVDEAFLGKQSAEIQKALRAQNDQMARASAVFLNPDDTFNIAAAIYHRLDMWTLYADQYTSVKESQTEDPRVVKFMVGLDLGPFCAYARPIEQLQSN